MLREWGNHYNRGRPHISLGLGVPDPQIKKECFDRLSPRHLLGDHLMVCGQSVLGGLHHEYALVTA
jgi:hypothetical protein